MTIKWANPKQKLRQNFIKKHFDASASKILEIGAFASPTFTKSDHDVSYFDRLTREELIKSVGNNTAKAEAIVPQDYVSKEYLFAKEIKERFDLIVACHVIEHCPDVITWLNEVAQILSKGAYLYLAIPHKDYTSDILREPTTLREIMGNFRNKLVRPSIEQLADQYYYSRPIQLGSEVWNNQYSNKLSQQKYSTIFAATEQAKLDLANKRHVDCHCNVFTTNSFVGILTQITQRSNVPFTLETSEDVRSPYNEFHVLLRKYS